MRLIDSCITQLKAQGPSRTCKESQEEDLIGFSVSNLAGDEAVEDREHGRVPRKHVVCAERENDRERMIEGE